MKVMSTVLVALVLAALGASRAQGTEEWSFEAFQPIWTDNDISLSRVTVLTFNSGEVGVYAVLATCDSNRVMSHYGPCTGMKRERSAMRRWASITVGARLSPARGPRPGHVTRTASRHRASSSHAHCTFTSLASCVPERVCNRTR